MSRLPSPPEFEFATAGRIVFGAGKLAEAGRASRAFGQHALLVTGRNAGRAARLVELLSQERVKVTPFQVAGEPAVDTVRQGLAAAKAAECDLVIGFGGGSALDAAKAIAALLTNPGELFDYLEVVGRGQTLPGAGAPCLAIPTTAGTGTEVTRNSVLTTTEQRFKVSLRSPFLLPRLALVDPELTVGVSPDVTATTGLDALTQLIEPYVSHRANPLTDAFSLEGMMRVARSLRRAVEDGTDLHARADMSLASLLSGLCLANAGLGAVHGFAAPLGGVYSAPHGALCAALLPHAMRINLAALQQRDSEGEALRRFGRIAQVLTGDPHAGASAGVAWVEQLCADVHIQPLSRLGVRREDFPELVSKAAKASSMKANPIPLTPEELHELLERAF